MNEFWNDLPSRQSTIYTLAGFGFVSLVGLGIWAAVFLSPYVPTAVGSIGAAAVSLSQIFFPAPSTPFAPVATSTPFGVGSTTAETATSTAASTTPVQHAAAIVPVPGKETAGVYPLNGSAGNGALYGLPDLAVTINAVGYLTSASANTFVASTSVPFGDRPAVQFTIKNVGTNATGSWNFMALIPTQGSYIFQSQAQQSLNPGDSIDYTLGFDQAYPGINQIITISVNPDRTVIESNYDNDKATANITIKGS